MVKWSSANFVSLLPKYNFWHGHSIYDVRIEGEGYWKRRKSRGICVNSLANSPMLIADQRKKGSENLKILRASYVWMTPKRAPQKLWRGHAECESAVFSRPSLLPHIFSNSKSSAALLAMPCAPPVLYARNKSPLSRAKRENEEDASE